MLSVGHPVVYSVPDKHLTLTLKREGEVQGSVHHHELTEFAGFVTRVYEDGQVGLMIFPPNRTPVTIDKVPEGEGPGTARAPGGGKRTYARAPKPAPAPVAAAAAVPQAADTAAADELGGLNPLIVDDEELAGLTQ